MDGEAILTVTTAVVALTQLLKWMGVAGEKWGAVMVLALSFLGVVLWGYSSGSYVRTELFGFFAGWITVATSAAGVYGFTRAASDITAARKAPTQ